MDLIQSIKNIMPLFSPEKKLKNETKNQLISFLKELQKNITDDKITDLLIILEKKIINKKIKEDICDKIENLLKKIEVTVPDGLQLVNNQIEGKTIKDFFDDILKMYKNNEYPVLKYDRIAHHEFLKELVENTTSLVVSRYTGKHLMYMFILTLDDPEKQGRVFCEIGYTKNISKKYKEITEEYNCEAYLIGLVCVHEQSAEKRFHIQQKAFHPDTLYKININNKDKIYLLSRDVYDEFILNNEIIHKVDKTITDDNITDNDTIFFVQKLKNQYLRFLFYIVHQYDYMNKNKETVLTVIKNNKELSCLREKRSRELEHQQEKYDREREKRSRELEHQQEKYDREREKRDREVENIKLKTDENIKLIAQKIEIEKKIIVKLKQKMHNHS
jgi:hypothetical protein